MAVCMDYPLAMYRSAEDYQRATNKDEEKALRAEGYLSGHEFWSRYNQPETEPKPAVVEPKRKGKRNQ